MIRPQASPGDEGGGVAAEAAAWHARLAADHSGEPDRAAFDAWLAASPAHALAYAEVERTLRLSRAAADAAPVLALRHQTLTRLLVPRRRVGAAAAASIGVVGLMLATAFGASTALREGGAERGRDVADLQRPFGGRLYQTAVGERMSIGLSDGSTVILNTATRLRVAYTPGERHIVLESGEAYFDVAKGQRRPFVVTAADRNITAHGTAFDVRLNRTEVKVALFDGLVAVRGRDAAAAGEVRLRPNDVLVARGGVSSVRSSDDIAHLVGWRDGLIFFDRTTLAQAAAEVNRYVERPKIEVDPEIAQLQLSGAFRTGQTNDFVEALTQSFPVSVVHRSPDRIVLGQPSPAA